MRFGILDGVVLGVGESRFVNAGCYVRRCREDEYRNCNVSTLILEDKSPRA